MMFRKTLLIVVLFISYSGMSYSQQMRNRKSPAQQQLHDTYTLFTTTDSIKKNYIDSVFLNETELIDAIFYEEGKDKAPSFLWYQNNFNNTRVKLSTSNVLDSLPDEITILLVKKGESPFVFPVKNIKTSNYGWRWNRPHRGVDIRLNTGDSVLSCFDGVVRVARSLGNYGNLVVVRHYNGLETVYAHLSKINVKPLQIVKAGHLLGHGGSTGRSTGPHLHFEVRFQYEAFDPEWILDFDTYKMRSNRLYLDKTYFGIEPPAQKTKDYYTFASDLSESRELNSLLKQKYHTVEKGENLYSISKRYGVSVDDLQQLNNLDTEDVRGKRKIRIQ